MCGLGWGNLVAFDWNDVPVGREFDYKFLKKVKFPPHALPPPPPPSRHYIDRCIRVTNINFVLTASTHYQIEKVMRICKVKTRGEVL